MVWKMATEISTAEQTNVNISCDWEKALVVGQGFAYVNYLDTGQSTHLRKGKFAGPSTRNKLRLRL